MDDMGTGLLIIILLIAVAAYIFFAYCLTKIAEKTGQENHAWMAWIPIANFFLIIRMAGRPTWWGASILLAMIPIVNFIGAPLVLVVSIICWMEIARRCGHDSWWGIIAALIGIVGLPYRAFAEGNHPTTAEAEI